MASTMAHPRPIPSNVLAASAASRLTRMAETITLTSKLRTNDPTLVHLKLCRKPSSLFGDDDIASTVLPAFRQNTMVKIVEMNWRFLSALPIDTRVQLMEAIGSLSSIEKLIMEAIGPCSALVAALEQARHLQLLWIGALRLSSNRDVEHLAATLQRNRSIQQLNLYNIRPLVQGSYRLDGSGMVWFREENTRTEKLDLNPLLSAIAGIPTLSRIELDLQLKPDKMKRIRHDVLRNLCKPPRTNLMLNSCHLDDSDMLAISDELSQPTNCLEVFNLGRGNRISDLGWEALAQTMEHNLQLVRLFLPDNTTASETNPNDPALQSPIVAAHYAARHPPTTNHNSMIHHYSLSADCRAKMNFYVRLNQKNRKHLLRDAATLNDWTQFLIQESHDLNMIFYALQAVPDLFFV